MSAQGYVRWLDPFIVARIEFLEWAPEGPFIRDLPESETTKMLAT